MLVNNKVGTKLLSGLRTDFRMNFLKNRHFDEFSERILSIVSGIYKFGYQIVLENNRADKAEINGGLSSKQPAPF